MRADIHQIKSDLKACKIKEIFSQELGWDTLPEAPPETFYQGQKYVFAPTAQKKGFKIYQYTFEGRIPQEQILKQIDRPLNEFAAEHLTVYIYAIRIPLKPPR